MKISHALLAASAAVAILSAASASATTITFDDIALTNGNFQFVSNGYSGLNWSQIYALDAVGYGAQGANGYTNGMVSSRNVAFVATGGIGQVSATSPFTLNNAFFSSAWNNGMTITVNGLINNVQTFTDSFIVSQTGSTQRFFNWAGLTSVTFQASGGVDAGTFGSGTQLVIDNLTINAAVPEPATWGLMILGFGMIGAASRSRKIKTTVAYA